MASDTLLFTAPVSRPAFDGGALVTGMKIVNATIDVVTLNTTVVVRAIEDGIVGQPHVVTITGSTGATTLAQLYTALKTQVATALGVTFQ